MRPFAFRAEAALQLRRREHDHALRAQAAAMTARAATQREVDLAEAALRDADRQWQRDLDAPAPERPLGWYRSWRLRLDDTRRQSLLRRQEWDAQVERAAQVVAAARIRVESLERLRESAWSAWLKRAEHEDQKTINELATLRFNARRRVLG